MSDKHLYKYEIVTKSQVRITNRMNIGIEVSASRQSMARRILCLRYPNCQIIYCKPKVAYNVNADLANRFRL